MRANQIVYNNNQNSNSFTVMNPKIEQFFEDIAKSLSKNQQKQEKYLTLLNQLYADFAPVITELATDADKINSLFNTFTDNFFSLAQHTKKNASALMFTALIGTVTAQKDLIISKGQAQGGMDLCSGVLHCIQGFITDNANPDFLVSFNSFVDIVNNKGGLGSIWAFNDCMTVDNIGNLIKDVLLQNTTNDITTACAASLNKAGSLVQAQVRDLTLEKCYSFQNKFLADPCYTDGKIVGLNWAIAGIILGIIICCAIPVCIYKCAAKLNQ